MTASVRQECPLPSFLPCNFRHSDDIVILTSCSNSVIDFFSDGNLSDLRSGVAGMDRLEAGPYACDGTTR